MRRPRKFYMSKHGAVGNNATRDTAAAVEIYTTKMTRHGDQCIYDMPPGSSPAAYEINQDVLGMVSGGYGGVSQFLWPARLACQQTMVNEHVLRGTGRRSGRGTTVTSSAVGGSLDINASTWSYPADGTRSVIRFDSQRGRIIHGARIERLQMHAGTITNLVAIYGDGLQEDSGVFGCMTQGFRQGLALVYPPSLVDGRNANVRVEGNEFYILPPVSTTLASGASGSATTATLTSATNCNVGDYIAIELDAGGYHYATITAVSAPTVTFFPALPAGAPGDAASGNDVLHISPAADIWSGPGAIIAGNTAFGVQTIPLGPGFRVAGTDISIKALHSEYGSACLHLGGYALNWPSGVNYSEGIKAENIAHNAHSVTGCDSVRIEDRDVTAFGQRHRLSSIEVEVIRDGGGCTNLVTDAGGTDEGRAGLTVSVATQGQTLRRYAIGERLSGVVPKVETTARVTFTGTLTGCTTSPTGTIEAAIDGDAVTLEIPAISATSNTTAATITGMPAALRPTAAQSVVGITTDNGTTALGKLEIGTGGTITLHVGTSATFTNSGTKGVGACTVTYRRS